MTTIGPISTHQNEVGDSVTFGGKINPHHMQGGIGYEDVSFAYDELVDKETKRILEAALAKSFPDEKHIRVVGAFADYSKITDPYYREGSPIGYFRVKIGDQEKIMYVHPHDGDECLAAAAPLVHAMTDGSVNVVKAVTLPNGLHTDEVQLSSPLDISEKEDGTEVITSVYFHLEDFVPNSEWLAVKKINGLMPQLAELAASIYHAGFAIHDQEEDISEMRRVTMVHDVKPMQDALRRYESGELKKNGVQLPKVLLPYIDRFKEIYLNDLGEENFIPTTYNFIEKMIAVTDRGELWMIGAHDSAGRGGYQPMLTTNCSYDLGTFAARVLFNPTQYVRGYDDMAECVDYFIREYNGHVQGNLTRQELLHAAHLAMLKNAVYSLSTVLSGDYTQGIDAHIQKILYPIFEKLGPAGKKLGFDPSKPGLPGRAPV